MPNPQPTSTGKGTVMMLFGSNKVGKTTLIGTGKNTLIIRPPDDHTDSIPADAGCEELVVSEWSEMFEIFAWLQQGAHKDYDWVWLDTISLMQDRLLSDVVTDMLMRRPDLAMDSGAIRNVESWRELGQGGIKIPEFGPDKGEYKINMERLTRWVGDMTGIAKAGMFNFGISAHTTRWWDPTRGEHGEEMWAPAIRGKDMIPKICGRMNIIAYLQKQETGDGAQRVLLVDAPGVLNGEHLDCFPELKSGKHGIVEPTMAKIETAIKKSPKRTGGSTTTAEKPKRKPAATKKRRVVRKG